MFVINLIHTNQTIFCKLVHTTTSALFSIQYLHNYDACNCSAFGFLLLLFLFYHTLYISSLKKGQPLQKSSLSLATILTTNITMQGRLAFNSFFESLHLTVTWTFYIAHWIFSSETFIFTSAICVIWKNMNFSYAR